ncbi:MAG: hypothetical protein DWQ19_10695 [Crenarchaeota archaeon]|nr:MAG: hypothetical protein DWQ19_10695 [Thermoproteota archaeon]
MSIRDLAAEVLDHPDDWMDKPNTFLGWAKPNDLIGSPQEERIVELLEAIKHRIPPHRVMS